MAQLSQYKTTAAIGTLQDASAYTAADIGVTYKLQVTPEYDKINSREKVVELEQRLVIAERRIGSESLDTTSEFLIVM